MDKVIKPFVWESQEEQFGESSEPVIGVWCNLLEGNPDTPHYQEQLA